MTIEQTNLDYLDWCGRTRDVFPELSLGIGAYGISPFRLSEVDARTVHGHDERVTIENLRFGVEFMYRIVERVAR